MPSAERTTVTRRLNLVAVAILLSSVGHGWVDPKRTEVRFRPSPALPMRFERNAGQTDEQVVFLSRGLDYTVFLTPTETVFSLRKSDTPSRNRHTQFRSPGSALREVSSTSVLRMKLVGGNTPSDIEGLEQLAGKSHYFRNRDSDQRQTSVEAFAKVQYSEVYPGIDVLYRGTQRQLEYDFVVAPGADPRQIRLRFEGITNSSIDSDGALVLRLGETELREPKPSVYQEVDGRRLDVVGAYTRTVNDEIGFQLGPYDARLPLIIDPVIDYSTYLGGTGSDTGRAIAVGSDGSLYVAGETASVDFPTLNPLQDSNAGGELDVFVAKITANGSGLLFSTYIGGSGFEAIDLLALDAADNVYVLGGTNSDDFPTTPGSYRPTGRGRFVFKLNPTGDTLVYSTFVDTTESFTVDAFGSVYLIGETSSPTLVTINPLQPALAGGVDAFISKLNLDGSALVYATYFGGSGDDGGRGIAVDAAGNIHVGGMTTSTDFPTFNPFQGSYGGGCCGYGDLWAATITPDGSALMYSTYLGGNDNEVFVRLGVDAAGHAYLLGATDSTGFPTVNAFQPSLKGESDLILAKLDEIGTSLVYSTYIGGSANDYGNGISVDPSGAAYVTGVTLSTDFPVFRAVQPYSRTSDYDAFVTKLDSAGGPAYSTYLGGSQGSGGGGIASDAAGNAYVIGGTRSADFPVRDALQSTLAGAEDAFIVKIADPPCPEEVTEQVDIVRLPFRSFLFGLVRVQRVIIHNKTSVPIGGPLAIVMSDLKNAAFIGSPLKTSCVSSKEDPFLFVSTGNDNVLAANESVLAVLWFVAAPFEPITYTPRLISGVPIGQAGDRQ